MMNLSAVMTFVLTAGPVIIDLPGYNVRDCAPPIRASDGTWHLYATVINASQGTPGYYGEVGHFTARGDNAAELSKPWQYHGIVLERSADKAAWDSTGVFTPGIVEDGGVWTLFFGGVGPNFRNHQGSDFSEYQGIATSSSPYGPFVKSTSNPTIRSAVGPPPLQRDVGTCNVSRTPAGTNLQGSDMFSLPLPSEDACASKCCGTEECAGYTFTTHQPHSKAGEPCSAGSPCCWLKSSVTGREQKENCSSGVVAPPAPNGSWPFVRLDNPVPLVARDGTHLLLVKAVALNFTALLNVYLPAGGAATSFEPPFVERPGNPITHPCPMYEAGFENQEVFRGPDGFMHMLGNSHGKPGNPHLVSDPAGGLTSWKAVEVLHGLDEPAPVAAGVPGAGASEPVGFVRFGSFGNDGRLAVRFETIEWRNMEA